MYKRQVYGLIVGLFLYKELDYKKILPMFKSKVNFLGGMMFCFCLLYTSRCV